MKRAYTKPDILFESFSLSTSIANNCEVITDLPTNGICGVKLEGVEVNVFHEEIIGCALKTDDLNPKYDYLCYHVPSVSYNVFNS